MQPCFDMTPAVHQMSVTCFNMTVAPGVHAIQARVAGVIEYELLCQFDQLSLGDQFGTCAVGDEGRQLDAACRHYAALCGTLDAGVTHTSLCNRLKVQFRSDHTITGQGFVVNLTLVDNDRRSKVETSPRGQTARPHQFPWLALIEYNNFHICAGSVISNRWILTAAHCVINLSNPSRLRVRVGKYLRNVAETFEQVLTVEQIIVHCSYGRMTFDNDIALLKLTEDIKFTESVHPICLPYDHDVPASTQCEIAGWGYTHEGDANTESPVPRFGTVETQTNAACSAALVAQRVTVTDNMVCALARQAERSVDTCQGDSGGPLMLKVGSDGQVVQYGVVSWGIGCGRQGLPGVYTRVHKYTSWVVDVTQGCVYIHDPNIYVEGKMP